MYSHQLQPHHTTSNAIRIFRQIHKINSHSTVKLADKHLETVSLDTDDYTDLCLQYLTDTNIYRATPISPTQTSDGYLPTFLHTTNQHCSHTVRLYTHFYSNVRSIALPCFMDSPRSIKTSLTSLQSVLLFLIRIHSFQPLLAVCF